MKKILYIVIVFLLFCSNFFGQTLNGSYTIGGSNPDYITITAATNDLTLNGISGPVVFNIRSGVYQEHVTITTITGSSVTNTVTIQSETENPDDVTVKHLHTSSAIDENNTIYINGADNVYIKNITIESLHDPSNSATNDYMRVLAITNAAKNIHIIGNIIKTFTLYGNPAELDKSAILIGHSTSWGATPLDIDSIFINNNKINGGLFGIGMVGDKTISSHIYLSDNEFTDQKFGAVNLNGLNECSIVSNNINQTYLSTNSFVGIDVTDTEKSIHINRNKILLQNGHIGIDLFLIANTINCERIVSNNYISISFPTNSLWNSGVELTNVEALILAHNTIVIDKPVASDPVVCLKLNNSHDLQILNNILIQRNGGFGIYSINPCNNLTLDYNCYYSELLNPLASINGVVCNNLVDLQSNLNLDNNSIQQDPFLSGSPEIIPSNVLVYNSGITIPLISIDINGTPRSITPCIGAFEGVAPNYNLAVSYVNFQDMQFCPDQSFPLMIKIKNYGLNQITTAQIHFNGFVFPWVGNLMTNQESSFIDLGNYFVPLSINHQLPTISVHFPNGMNDQLPTNDSIFITINPSMKGNYFVGGSNPDFSNLTEVATAFLTNGICDDVIIKISPGTYSGHVVFQNISGLSANSSILITSLNQDSSTVTFSGNNSSFTLNNLSYFSITNIGILDASAYGTVRFIKINGGNNINISNNKFLNGSIEVNHASVPTHHLFFAQNFFEMSITGISYPAGFPNINLKGGASNSLENITCIKNKSQGSNGTDVRLSNCKEIIICENNYSGNRQSSLYLDSCANFTIYKNRFNNRAIRIIEIANTVGNSTNPSLIHTNMLVGMSGVTEGIFLFKSSYVNLFHNTLRTTSYGFTFGLNTSNVIILNNIIHANTSAVRHITISPISTFYSEHNNYYRTSPNQNVFEVASNALSLPDFSALYGLDSTSFISIPTFISPSDLHLINSIAQDGTGIIIPGISTDIDNDLIPQLPDIGADQFDLDMQSYNYNIGIVEVVNPNIFNCQADDTLKIKVANLSDDLVNYFTIKWYLFGNQIGQFICNQTIQPYDTIDVLIGIYPFNNNTLYDLTFNVSLPNNLVDVYFPDDSKNLLYSRTEDFEIESRKIEDCSSDFELVIPNFPRNNVTWSTGSTDNSIIVSSPGIYLVEIETIGGCTITKSITIN